MLSKGDIILANAPFSDGTGSKLRPVVVLTKPNYYNDVLAAEITTKNKPDTIRLQNPWKAGVRPGSKVKVRIITVTIIPDTRHIGNLSPEDAKTVRKKIKSLL